MPANIVRTYSSVKPARLLTFTALLTSLNIAMSSFGLPVPGGHMYLNDVIITASAILLDPFHAFLVGGLGAFLGDLFFYPAPMFVSLVTHGLQAVVIALIAKDSSGRPTLQRSLFASLLGILINVAGYTIGRAFVYATMDAAMLKLPFQILQAGAGSLIGVLLVFRMGLTKVLERYFGA